MLNYKSKNLIYDFKKKKFVTQSHVIKEFKNNKKLHFDGSFSFVKKIKKNFLCCRDKIGSKKVFYGINNKSKKILFSRNFLDLLKKCNIDTIRSIPKGCIVEIGDNGHIIFKKKFEIKKNFRLEKSFQKLLKIYLTQIKKIHGNTCIVCLSSGLDSTIIAYYAKKVFKKVITINLHFNSKNYPTKPIEKVNSSKIAELLNTNHKNISISFEEIFSDLNKIIYSCQDWRDFNVHCAFLNYAIAKYIKKNNLNYPVLTGDLMNEYFADYESEIINNIEYYKNPKVSKAVLRKFYIKGLDSSDREIGIFEKFNLKLYQPYSILYDIFLYQPDGLFLKKNSKNIVNSKFVPNRILKLISKKKIRAQTGDMDGGVLNFFIKKKLTDQNLKKYFIKNFKLKNKWLNTFILSGMYKT